jgi:DNA polymerase-1
MKIQATTEDAYQLFHNGILALARAEQAGIRIDTKYCQQKSAHLDRKIGYYQKKLEKTKLYRHWSHVFKAKTNIYSNHQLSHLLYDRMKLKPVKVTESGQGATDEDALRRLNVPELDLILRIRKLAKMKTTYLEAFLREQTDGFIHPSFNLHNVRTYRSSSADPNFQNIPKRDKEAMKICRRAILPRPGHMLIEADFSALEVNISECYHKDPKMMEYLLDKNSDMHLDMAKQIFQFEQLDKKVPAHAILRQAAKNGFVFPQFYGDYYLNNASGICDWVHLPTGKWKKGVGLELPDKTHISDHFLNKGISSFDRFAEHMKKIEDDFWNRRFKEYGRWRERVVRDYRKRGWLKMHTGFVCSGIMRRNEIFNYPIQGSAFHCLLFTFIELDRIMLKEKWKSKLIGQIHDSILIDADPSELPRIKEALQAIVKETLPNAWKWIIVPLEIDVDEYAVDHPWIAA